MADLFESPTQQEVDKRRFHVHKNCGKNFRYTVWVPSTNFQTVTIRCEECGCRFSFFFDFNIHKLRSNMSFDDTTKYLEKLIPLVKEAKRISSPIWREEDENE